MHVYLSKSDNFVVPPLCPCCLAQATHVEHIEGAVYGGVTATRARVSMPVCGDCVAHREVGQPWLWRLPALGTLCFFLGFIPRVIMQASRGTVGYLIGEGLAVLFVASLVAAPAVYFWSRWQWQRTHNAHASVGVAVSVAPFELSGLHFSFKNDAYGRAFKDANVERLAPRQ